MAVASSSNDQPSPEKITDYKSAIENHGDIDSMYKLASLLSHGSENVPADAKQALLLYKRAISDGNHLPSMLGLGSLLHSGFEDIPPNLAAAADLYELAIEEWDDPIALCKRALLTLEDTDRTLDDEERALDYLQRSADKGHAPAIGELGLMHHVGWGSFTKDVSKAAELFKKAIEVGRVTNSMYYLAFIVLEGYDDVKPDPDEAIRLLQQAVDEGGDTDAMVFLARILRDGQGGVERDYPRAIDLLQRAVQEGHSAALFHLACLYLTPEDESFKDVEKAVALFRRAMEENGDKHATYKLAMLYKEGEEGVARDISAATELYERAVQMGNHIQSLYELSMLLQEGSGDAVKKDVEKSAQLIRDLDAQIQTSPRSVDVEAANLLLLAAEKGHPFALTLAGIHFKFGDDPFGLDRPKARDMLQKASDGGNSEAMFHLGMMLMDAQDEEEGSMAKAMVLFRKAADECDNLAAINVLASFLLEGYRDVEADVSQAVRYLERAIQLGDNHSMNRLGMLYLEGDLLPEGKDVGKAVGLFEKAMEVHDVNALHNLAILKRNGAVGSSGSANEGNMSEAVALLLDAVEKRRHFRSMVAMADLYLTGWATEKSNAVKAGVMIEEAVEMGDLDSGNLHAALKNAGYEDTRDEELEVEREEGEIEDYDDDDSLDYTGRATMFKDAMIDKDNSVAFYALGCLVQESQADICADTVAASRWFQRAFDVDGHVPSAIALATLLVRGDEMGLAKNVDRAKDILQSAANNGSEEAGNILKSL